MVFNPSCDVLDVKMGAFLKPGILVKITPHILREVGCTSGGEHEPCPYKRFSQSRVTTVS